MEFKEELFRVQPEKTLGLIRPIAIASRKIKPMMRGEVINYITHPFC